MAGGFLRQLNSSAFTYSPKGGLLAPLNYLESSTAQRLHRPFFTLKMVHLTQQEIELIFWKTRRNYHPAQCCQKLNLSKSQYNRLIQSIYKKLKITRKPYLIH